MGFWSFFQNFFPNVWFFRGIQLRSYTGVLLVNSIKLKRKDKRLRKVTKRLREKYKPQKIGKLYNTYSRGGTISIRGSKEKLERFRAELRDIANSFVEDYRYFRMYLVEVIELINQSTIIGKREQYREITQIEELFNEIYEKAYERNESLTFPKGEVNKFRKQLKILLEDLRKDWYIEGSTPTRIERGKHPKGVNWLSRLWWSSRPKIYRMERHEIRKLDKDVQFYDELFNRIVEELKGDVRQDFLLMLIQLFRRVDIADRRLESINKDLQEVVLRLKDELNEVKQGFIKFYQLLKNEPEIKRDPNLAKLEAVDPSLKELEEIIANLEKREFKNAQALIKRLKPVYYGGSYLTEVLEKQAV